MSKNSRTIRLVRRHDEQFQSGGNVLPKGDRLGREKLWNDRSLLHTLFGRANDGWRADADPGRSARHGRPAGLERLCLGR